MYTVLNSDSYVFACHTCGSLVASGTTELHTVWHKKQEQFKEEAKTIITGHEEVINKIKGK